MKKKFFVMAVLLSASLALSACGGPGSSGGTGSGGEVSITYWNLLTGADGQVMKQMIKTFNSEYDGRIEVIDQSANEDVYYDNLERNIPIGRGPDVAIMHSYRVQSYANQGLIVPLDSWIESAEIDMNDYPEEIVKSLAFEGKTYAIPLDMHPTAIYYNKDLLASYGCEVPTNREELIAAALKADNEEGGVWGLPLSSQFPSPFIYTTALYQFGGTEIKDGEKPGFNTQAGVQALDSFASLIHTYHLSPISLGNDQDMAYFRNGKALFHINGVWMINSIKTSSVNFDVIPLSNMFNSDSEEIAVRSHTFVFPKQNKENDAKREAAMEFVHWMTKNSHVWATAGQIPASKTARESEAFKAVPYLQNFGNPDNFRIGASSPYYFEAYTPVYSRITSALLSPGYNAAEMLAAAEEEGLKLVKEVKELLGK